MTIKSSRSTRVNHQFVRNLPDDLAEGIVYISIEYATVAHKCFCGCRREVITPLSPTDWRLIYDGQTISLDPSIGNWNYPCQSHYWIEENRVRWAPKWSRADIDQGRRLDRVAKAAHFHENARPSPQEAPDVGLWQRIRGWFYW